MREIADLGEIVSIYQATGRNRGVFRLVNNVGDGFPYHGGVYFQHIFGKIF